MTQRLHSQVKFPREMRTCPHKQGRTQVSSWRMDTNTLRKCNGIPRFHEETQTTDSYHLESSVPSSRSQTKDDRPQNSRGRWRQGEPQGQKAGQWLPEAQEWSGLKQPKELCQVAGMFCIRTAGLVPLPEISVH